MALSAKDILSALQWDFLSLFFHGAPTFLLTGGTALSAFYLQHRYSEDLALFTLDSDAFDRVPLYVADAAARLTASVLRSRPRLSSAVTRFPGKGSRSSWTLLER